ncbi:MAG: proline dehydrogenase [Acidobacteria bacterium]|nr:MAG: proline dehydrogenase [Acidobacteriota bacterium]
MMRSVFLWASQNRWLRERLPRYRFARKSVARFMPGEEFADALAAAQTLAKQGINAVFTKLGENIGDKKEAAEVREHYLGVLGNIERTGLNAEISVKLTQLGLDLSKETCFENLRALVERAGENNIVWIDMESSPYLDRTLELYRRAREAYANVGVCLQAYLYRTAKDLAALRPLGPAVRLVKGAYQEPASVAFSRKRDVDENFFALSKELLSEASRQAGVRAAVATHDGALIRRIAEHALAAGLSKQDFEFQMLYGIQRQEQLRLAQQGWRSRVLFAYGSFWFPWYMRRLAERPANAWFVLRNLFS